MFRELGSHAAPLLMVSAEQEEKLGLEGIALAVGVKRTEEWVFLKHFQKQVSGKSGMDEAGKRGFPYAYHTFYGNEHEQRLLSVIW